MVHDRSMIGDKVQVGRVCHCVQTFESGFVDFGIVPMDRLGNPLLYDMDQGAEVPVHSNVLAFYVAMDPLGPDEILVSMPIVEGTEPTIGTSRGLVRKYIVVRTDGRSAPGEKHEACEHFVLDLDHDKFAAPALAAYADACAEEYPELARDLESWLRRIDYVRPSRRPKFLGLPPLY